ncbi:MAG TPA: S53 family peptidase [Candidatus Tumulicola sp.]|jgi:subtilase family serine protease
MKFYARALALAGIAAIAACSSASNQTLPSGAAAALPQIAGNAIEVPPNTRAMCNYVPRPGEVRCYSLMRTDIPQREGVQPNVAGYGPPDLEAAYHLPHGAKNGKGQTVGVVIWYDDPNAESDVGVYRQQFGLPVCTTKNKCFKKVNEQGKKSPLPRADANASGEISLDLDMASAICPNCKIVLVEANGPFDNDLNTAEDTAVRLGADAVNNSWGGGEEGATNSHFDHPGTMIVASSGDSGYGAQQPCSYATVVCVGGTTLQRGTGTRGWTETSWRGAGSGCSARVPKPAWQTDTGCTMRSEADVSAVANPSTGVAVYDTYGSHGWVVFGGTSVASPITAGIFALAKNAKKQNYGQNLWKAGGTAKFWDITGGLSNGTCPPQYPYICTPGVGYDGVTGWGTPNGIKAY